MSKEEVNLVTAEVEKNDIDSDNIKAEVKVKKGSSNKFLFLLFFLIAIGIVAASSAAAYYLWMQQQQQEEQVLSVQRSIGQLESKLNNIKLQLINQTKISAAQSEHIQKLKKMNAQATKYSQQAINVVNRSQRGWVLAEIDYLLRIAHQRIAVARDIGGAIAALKGADLRLQELGDISLFNVRKQLAKDIASLQAIHKADVNGISLAIDQIIVYLPELPFKSIKDEIKIQFTDEVLIEEVNIEEKTFLDSVFEAVQKIGDIRIHQKSIKAATSEQQQKQIEQLLRTYLLSARLAALRFNQIQFLHEINQAKNIVVLHYEQRDNRVRQLQAMLLTYEKVELSPDLPELNKAWLILQKAINASSATKIKPMNNKIELGVKE